MTHEQLLALNFTFNTWTDEGEVFTEYILQEGNVKIEISGTTLFEIAIGNEYTEVDIDSVEELELLIKVLKIK